MSDERIHAFYDNMKRVRDGLSDRSETNLPRAFQFYSELEVGIRALEVENQALVARIEAYENNEPMDVGTDGRKYPRRLGPRGNRL